jgi:hypothetical protein
MRGLRGIDACVVVDGPKFDADEKRWVIAFTLRRGVGVRFIGAVTRWFAIADESYPFGAISVYPASKNGIAATFPHQSRNTPNRGRKPWRGGKLCLDSPFGGERLLTVVRDPVGDAETRLRWHVDRAVEWVRRAANGNLLATGDPFELPIRQRTDLPEWNERRVVHDESTQTFEAWNGREGTAGIVDFGLVTDVRGAIGSSCFVDRTEAIVRTWSGRTLAKCDDVRGFWWLWPRPLVLEPWQSPHTWGDLRRVSNEVGIDPDEFLRWLLLSVRGAKTSNILLLGFPVSLRVGSPFVEIHWDAILLPSVEAEAGKPPNGFRGNARGWWWRDRHGAFADHAPLKYLRTENWSSDRLQARGRLPQRVRDLRVALLGAGALGSSLAEMLARAGINQIALVDDDLLEAGNVCRHLATLADIGKSKVHVVAERLRQISPTIRVTAVEEKLRGSAEAIVVRLDPYDVIIDCTSSDEALDLLSTAWWPLPRIFASFSMGYGGKRVFSFGANGNEFPRKSFADHVRPWIQHESRTWAENDEVFEGAGCWMPLFPARFDDVVLAAASCLKELEAIVMLPPRASRFRVFSQTDTDEGFGGSSPEFAPPSHEGSLR